MPGSRAGPRRQADDIGDNNTDDHLAPTTQRRAGSQRRSDAEETRIACSQGVKRSNARRMSVGVVSIRSRRDNLGRYTAIRKKPSLSIGACTSSRPTPATSRSTPRVTSSQQASVGWVAPPARRSTHTPDPARGMPGPGICGNLNCRALSTHQCDMLVPPRPASPQALPRTGRKR